MIWGFLIAMALWMAIFLFINLNVSIEASEIEPNNDNQCLTIVIAARNEEGNLGSLVKSIANQTWLPTQLEIRIVDDHSEDGTYEEALALKRSYEHLNICVDMLKEGGGKKMALKQGLLNVSDGLIYLTDADVCLNPNALLGLSNALNKNNAMVAFGVVLMTEQKGWKRLMTLENLNNQIITEAFISFQRPIMANGANMMFRSKTLGLYIQSLNSGTVSGDDVFFAQSLTQGQVVEAFDQRYAVITESPKSFRAFINQRIRWAAKSTNYESTLSKFFGALILGLNLVFVFMMLALFLVQNPGWILMLLVFKVLLEYSFHSYWFRKYQIEHKLFDALILSLVYPVYTTVIAALAILGVGFSWKGRSNIR
jgi:poly-beta-1,6-N-acetyl-D-glucosamine synthase